MDFVPELFKIRYSIANVANFTYFGPLEEETAHAEHASPKKHKKKKKKK